MTEMITAARVEAEASGQSLSVIRHGSPGGYRGGCRCGECRKWRSAQAQIEKHWAPGHGPRMKPYRPFKPVSSQASALMLPYALTLRTFVRRRIRDAALADDVVQETYLAVMRRLQGRPHIENMGAYLTVVAKTQIHRAMRQRALDLHHLLIEGVDTDSIHPAVGDSANEDETFVFENSTLRALSPRMEKTIIRAIMEAAHA